MQRKVKFYFVSLIKLLGTKNKKKLKSLIILLTRNIKKIKKKN